MYRKPKPRDRSGVLDLDSLMDILSCLVGVMLFLVIYTVLELGSAAYQAEVLVSREPVPESRRVVVLASGGTIRLLDARPALARLLSGFEIVRSFAEVPVFLEANREIPTDPYFAYTLELAGRSSTDLLSMLEMQILERPGIVGEGLAELDDESTYAEMLELLDPEEAWLAFAVDAGSIDVFRRAREMAIARNFATGFDLLSLEFPLTVALSEDGLDDLLSPIGLLDKPQR